MAGQPRRAKAERWTHLTVAQLPPRRVVYSQWERWTRVRLADHDIGSPLAAVAPFAVAGLLLSAAAVWVALSGSGPEPRGLAATAHALVIAVPLGVGLYALRTLSAPADRFGRLLVLAGLLSSPTMLAESADSGLYSIGRVSVWLAEVLLVYVVLAFPSGRLVSRADRLLVRAAMLVVGVLFLPTALLVEQYPTPTPWSSCGSDCPTNAFMVVGSEPGFVDAIVTPSRRPRASPCTPALRCCWRAGSSARAVSCDWN